MFRIPNGIWKLSLLTLPFVKVIYDFLKGVPPTSILYKHIDPFTIAPGLQQLNLGLGGSFFSPTFRLLFKIKDTAQNEFGASAGDYLYYWISREFDPTVPSYILLGVISVSVFLMLRRIFEAVRFEIVRKKDRLASLHLKNVKVGHRIVDVYISKSFLGTPFTGNVFQPYIAIPEETYLKLSNEERKAVIAHELGHVRQFDVAFTICIHVLGDIFGFIPGYRRLSRKIDRLREIIADQFAVKSGISGEYLASALLKLKEISFHDSRFVLYSAFTREKSLLKVRVNNLLGNNTEKKQRFGWSFLAVRVIVSVWIVGAVLSSNLVGNHTNSIRLPEAVSKKLTDYFNIRTYQE